MRHAAILDSNTKLNPKQPRVITSMKSDESPTMPTRNEPVQATRKRMLPNSTEDDPQRAKHCDQHWALLQEMAKARARHREDD